MNENRVYTMIITKDTENLIVAPSWKDNMEQAEKQAAEFIAEWYPHYKDNYKVIEVEPEKMEKAWWNDPSMLD